MMSDPLLDQMDLDKELLLDDEDDSLYEVLDVLLDDEHMISTMTGGAEESDSAIAPIKTTTTTSTTAKKRSTEPRGAGKKRKLNPDATMIAANTEAALKELELDMSSEETKKMRRQIRNRLSAQFHRDRKNMYIKELEDKIAERDKKIASLEDQLLALRAERDSLRVQVCGNVTASSASSIASGFAMLTDSEYGSSAAHTPSYEPTSAISDELPLLPYFVAPSCGASDSLHLRPAVEESQLPETRALFAPAPLMKSLSILSVLCLLCFCGQFPNMNYPTKSTAAAQSYFPDSEPAEMGQLLPSQGLEHRRLSASEDAAFTLLSESLQQLSANDSLMIPASVMNAFGHSNSSNGDAQRKQHLRRSAQLDGNSSVTQTEATHAVFSSKGVSPWDYSKNWAAHTARPFQSYSRIGLTQGFALFDPSMQLSDAFPQAFVAAPFSDVSSRHPRDWQESKPQSHLALPRPEMLHSRAAAVRVLEEHDMNEKSGEGHHINPSDGSAGQLGLSLAEPTKQLITVRDDRPLWKSLPSVRESSQDRPVESADSHEARQKLIAQLLSQSNIVSVSIPAWAIRTGTSMQDSAVGTVESIVKLFNLSTTDDRAGAPLANSSIANASVELNCIVLSAKLVVNSPMNQ